MHPESAHKIAFHEPECFCQQQRIWSFGCYPIDHFTPKFLRKEGIKLVFRQGKFSPAGDIPAVSWFGEPETLVMFFSEGHRSIKTDDREEARHVQDGLDD